MWQLKRDQPAFEMVDGPFAGKRFTHDKSYQDIPETMASRFEHTGEAIIAALAEHDAEQELTDTAEEDTHAEHPSES